MSFQKTSAPYFLPCMTSGLWAMMRSPSRSVSGRRTVTGCEGSRERTKETNMGADYYAYALIGCEVDPKLLWESHPIRQCRHDIPEGFRFCPECGKPNQPIITYRRRFGEDREDYDCTEEDFLHDGLGYDAEEPD